MSDEQEKDLGNASRAFLDQLDQSGFFKQIDDLGNNLKTIAEDLKVLGDATVQRVKETENLVAHVLAIEAVLAVTLRNTPIDLDAVMAVIDEKTAGVSEETDGAILIRAIAEDIIQRSRN